MTPSNSCSPPPLQDSFSHSRQPSAGPPTKGRAGLSAVTVELDVALALRTHSQPTERSTTKQGLECN